MKKLWALIGAFCFCMLMCERGEPSQVSNLTLEATDGGEGIVLTWDQVTDAETYNVYFNGELLTGEVTTAVYTHAEPARTGYYTVSASAVDLEGPESDSVSTQPVIQILTVYELNGEGDQGIAFDLEAGSTAVYSMANDSYQDKIDCYFTDFGLGYEGDRNGMYHLAGAEVVEQDPGNTWLESGWRLTGISDPLEQVNLDEVSLVPYYSLDSLMYWSYTEVDTGEVFAIWSPDSYYALIEVQEMEPSIGQLTIRTAFQKVKEFRLFKR